ncbi:MAG: lytic murein transglycosylase, partial [Rhodanobacteraceae bacterium]
MSRLRLLASAFAALIALPLHASDRADQREQFRSALAAAAHGPELVWKKLAATLDQARYPLTPYVELTALRKRVAKLSRADVEDFLKRWPDTLAASDLRDAYLRELARRKDWATFRAMGTPGAARDLQCDALQAELAAGKNFDYARDLDTLWLDSRALPNACDPVFSAARHEGVLTDAQVWERLHRMAANGNASSAADAAALLSGSDRAAADRVVAAVRDPVSTFAKAKTWTDDAQTRDAVSYALMRYARRNSAATETAWADLETRFKWAEAQKNRILNAIAVFRSTSYSPDALARMKALPADAEDDTSREWRVRIALSRSDWKETLAALDALSSEQKTDPRWRYLRARILGKLGRKNEADALFTQVAREANFYGFLAADWTGQPYSICPRKLARDAGAEAALAKQPDLERAFEFRELDMLGNARREWNFAMTKLDDGQRRLAADLAYRRGWYDRAVFAFSREPETQQLYE